MGDVLKKVPVREQESQVRAKNFYEKIGYVEYGEVYFDEYCEHIKMKKIL